MRVLMVCLGNICRSPMAEAVLAHLAPEWTVDSAGTGGWHAGERPDPRTLAELERHGIATAHRARQVTRADFRAFDRIYAMDRQNLRDLAALRPADATAELRLLGEHDPQGVSEVPDPYYDGPEAFAAVYEQVERCCRSLVGADNRK
jgi:protein-tyrosine-phosphatase